MNKTECLDIESLSRYGVGQGSEKWRRDVADHLADCPACGRELSALDGVVDVLNRVPVREAPDQWGSISARLEPRRSGWLAWPAYSRLRAFAAVTALVLVAVFAGLHLVNAPAPEQNTVKHQTAASQASANELAQSHAALAWNDPFSDSASLAVMASRRNGSRTE